MDFIDKIRELAARIPKQLEHIQTEEATKNALIMPFIAALGYNVFDPTEVTPELNADIGIKKGEKVDYAILREGKPIVLFECKHHRVDLGKEHASQLYRYFSVTEARFSVLTNGLHYWFYTDLDASNKMDAKPFFEFNMLDIREQDVEELKKFSKTSFDINGILNTASELKYLREIKRVLAEQVQEPSDEFVRFITTQVYPGKITQAVKGQFAALSRKAFKSFVNDQINERLKTALGGESINPPIDPQPVVVREVSPEPQHPSDPPAVTTTAEEIEGFYIIKAILREHVETRRIVMRDVQTYCGILLDDTNRKPICRLWFNGGQKYIGLFDNEQRKEQRIAISGLDELYQFADRLKTTVLSYAK